MINFYILHVVETAINATTMLIGFIIFSHVANNLLHRTLGLISMISGLMVVVDNVFLHTTIINNAELYDTILSIDTMLKFFIMAYTFSLLSSDVLYMGILTPSHILLLSIPLFIVSTYAICFELFDGTRTLTANFADIAKNSTNLDIRIRLSIFGSSLLFPILNFTFIILFLKKEGYNTLPQSLLLNLGLFFIATSFYIISTTHSNTFLASIFGITNGTILLSTTILHLFKQTSPMIELLKIKSHQQKENNDRQTIAKEKSIHQNQEESSHRLQSLLERSHFGSMDDYLLYKQIYNYMHEEAPFVQGNFNEWVIIKKLSISYERLNYLICISGFTNFREFVAFWRIQHFKKLAKQEEKPNVKYLIFKCGFQSRATFYRNFERIEQITPKAYISSLTSDHYKNEVQNITRENKQNLNRKAKSDETIYPEQFIDKVLNN